MFPMRIKINPPRNNELRCCFCLHVRTATILIGIWQLILHVLALSVLAIVMRNHHITMERTPMNEDVEPGNLLPTPLSKIKNDDNPYYLPTTQDGRTIYSSDVDMGALMTVCTLAISLLMVYGTVKGKATHLLPYFCLQLFDFAIATLTATGYFCYLRSVHQFVSEHWHGMPFRKELLQLSPQSLSLLVLIAFLFTMLWKAYCISIVWRCYKYLTLRQQNARSTVHYILRGDESERVVEPEYLLPDYEAACASFKQPPPPSYQAAMEAQPPAYPNTAQVVNLVQGEDFPRYGLIITQEVNGENAVGNDGNNVNVENNNVVGNNANVPGNCAITNNAETSNELSVDNLRGENPADSEAGASEPIRGVPSDVACPDFNEAPRHGNCDSKVAVNTDKADGEKCVGNGDADGNCTGGTSAEDAKVLG